MTEKTGKRSLTIAALLALFLGGIGGHKFYLGQTKKGLLYLLFCWTLIPTLIALVELIVLLFTTPAAFDHRYNGGPDPATLEGEGGGWTSIDPDEKKKMMREAVKKGVRKALFKGFSG